MTRNQFRLLALTAVAASALTLPALAQDASVPPNEMPPVTDNGPKGGPDGKGPGSEHFKRTDTNGDGFLSKDEMRAEQEKRLDDLFAKVDTNKDGKLSPEEMKKGRDAMHDKMKHRGGDAPPSGNAPAGATAQ